MANQVNVQASLALTGDISSIQATGTKPITQTGQKGILTQVILNSSSPWTKLIDLSPATPPMASLGYLFVKNIDPSTGATPTVQLTLDSSAAQIYATLKPSEFCLIPVNQNAVSGTGPIVYAKPSAANVAVMVGAVEI